MYSAGIAGSQRHPLTATGVELTETIRSKHHFNLPPGTHLLPLYYSAYSSVPQSLRLLTFSVLPEKIIFTLQRSDTERSTSFPFLKNNSPRLGRIYYSSMTDDQPSSTVLHCTVRVRDVLVIGVLPMKMMGWLRDKRDVTVRVSGHCLTAIPATGTHY